MMGRSGTPGDESRVLPCPEFDFWLHAIVTDNHTEIDRRLSMVTSDEKDLLLNGCFQVTHNGIQWNIKSRFKRIWGDIKVSRPWCLAGVCNAHRVMSTFIRHGVRMTQKDQGGYNILHCLVYFAYLNQPLEVDMKDTYFFLKKILLGRDSTVLKRLLHAENSSGKRPLEMAAHLGTCDMFLSLFETEGIYLAKQDSLGLYSLQWFDITSYETIKPGHRRQVSPAYLMTFLEENKLKDTATKHLYASDLVQSWTSAKIGTNKTLLYLWCFIRVFFVILYASVRMPGVHQDATIYVKTTQTYNTTTANATSERQGNTSLPLSAWHEYYEYLEVLPILALCIYAVIVLAYDIHELCIRYLSSTHSTTWLHETPKGPKVLLLCDWSYRLAQFTFGLSVLVLTLNATMVAHGEPRLSVMTAHFWHGIAAIAGTWSLLYFLQMVPWIGLIIAAFQKVVKDYIKILVLYITFLIIYTRAFQKVPEEDVTDNSAECSVIYYLFYVLHILQNLPLLFTSGPDILNIAHSVVVTFATSLVVSVLIATFLNCYSDILQNRLVVQTIQRLSVVCTLENRLTWLFPRYLERNQKYFFIQRGSRMFTPRLVLKRRLRTRQHSDRRASIRISRYDKNAKIKPKLT